MSFRSIRSRLKPSSGGCDSDQGSPSRSSFFHQLASLLAPDDVSSKEVINRINKKSIILLVIVFCVFSFSQDLADPGGGKRIEDQLLSLVMDQGRTKKKESRVVPSFALFTNYGSTPHNRHALSRRLLRRSIFSSSSLRLD